MKCAVRSMRLIVMCLCCIALPNIAHLQSSASGDLSFAGEVSNRLGGRQPSYSLDWQAFEDHLGDFLIEAYDDMGASRKLDKSSLDQNGRYVFNNINAEKVSDQDPVYLKVRKTRPSIVTLWVLSCDDYMTPSATGHLQTLFEMRNVNDAFITEKESLEMKLRSSKTAQPPARAEAMRSADRRYQCVINMFENGGPWPDPELITAYEYFLLRMMVDECRGYRTSKRSSLFQASNYNGFLKEIAHRELYWRKGLLDVSARIGDTGRLNLDGRIDLESVKCALIFLTSDGYYQGFRDYYISPRWQKPPSIKVGDITQSDSAIFRDVFASEGLGKVEDVISQIKDLIDTKDVRRYVAKRKADYEKYCRSKMSELEAQEIKVYSNSYVEEALKRFLGSESMPEVLEIDVNEFASLLDGLNTISSGIPHKDHLRSADPDLARWESKF